MISRRTLLLIAAAGLTVWATPRVLDKVSPLPPTEPLPGLPGFTRLRTGALSTGSPALLGLDRPSGSTPADLDALRAAPHQAIHGAVTPGSLPVAVFTDVNCANCREMSGTFQALGRREDVQVTWHELPLLGPTSEMGARAALAAAQQGGYGAVHARLMRSAFRPSPAYLREIARDAGLDPDRLVADMQSAAVAQHLAQAVALAQVLGIPGTPALVLDRTVVIGAVGPTELDRLMRRARRAA